MLEKLNRVACNKFADVEPTLIHEHPVAPATVPIAAPDVEDFPDLSDSDVDMAPESNIPEVGLRCSSLSFLAADAAILRVAHGSAPIPLGKGARGCVSVWGVNLCFCKKLILSIHSHHAN